MVSFGVVAVEQDDAELYPLVITTSDYASSNGFPQYVSFRLIIDHLIVNSPNLPNLDRDLTDCDTGAVVHLSQQEHWPALMRNA